MELVRTQIIAILVNEFSNQRTLWNAEPDGDEKTLALNSIPTRVYEEKFGRPGDLDPIYCNVVLATAPLDGLTGIEQQTDDTKYYIEFYVRAKDNATSTGDRLASLRLQRLAMMCRHILMHASYLTLGFDKGFIGYRRVTALQIAQPNEGLDAGNYISGQMTVTVKILETQNKIEGVPLLISDTVHLVSDDETKGYYYQINI